MRQASRVIRCGVILIRPLAALWPARARRADAEREALLATVLAAAFARHGWRGLARRWFFEAADTAVAGVRLQPARTPAIIAACAAIAIGIGALPRSGEDGAPGELLVRGADPAGEFSLTIRGGVVAAATIGSTAIPRTQLEQTGDSIRVIDHEGRPLLAVAYDGRSAIRWSPRARVVQ